MNIPEVVHLDVSRFRLREATERVNQQEYDLVRECEYSLGSLFRAHGK